MDIYQDKGHQPFPLSNAKEAAQVERQYQTKTTLHDEYVTTKHILTIIEDNGEWYVQRDDKQGNKVAYTRFSNYDEAKAWCEQQCDEDAENQQQATKEAKQ